MTLLQIKDAVLKLGNRNPGLALYLIQKNYEYTETKAVHLCALLTVVHEVKLNTTEQHQKGYEDF